MHREGSIGPSAEGDERHKGHEDYQFVQGHSDICGSGSFRENESTKVTLTILTAISFFNGYFLFGGRKKTLKSTAAVTVVANKLATWVVRQ
jgi:hypothetical protein